MTLQSKLDKETKHFFRRGEVAKLLEVPKSTIQHWERSVKTLDRKIKRSKDGGYRLYSREVIFLFAKIQNLLKEKRYSLEEVEKYFQKGFANDTDQEGICLEPSLSKQAKSIALIEEAIEKLEQLQIRLG